MDAFAAYAIYYQPLKTASKKLGGWHRGKSFVNCHNRKAVIP
jgi:hypothetical protein